MTLIEVVTKITAFRKSAIDLLTLGASFERSSGFTIEQLKERACVDRLRLSLLFIQEAAHTLRQNSPLRYRTTINRSYYSMYHTARALVFINHGGDDHQHHDVLPRQLPNDLPGGDWQASLKDARSLRNEVDYDPHPLDDVAFSLQAAQVYEMAKNFRRTAITYLRRKGINI